jgi:hypothetical protein
MHSPNKKTNEEDDELSGGLTPEEFTNELERLKKVAGSDKNMKSMGNISAKILLFLDNDEENEE